MSTPLMGDLRGFRILNSLRKESITPAASAAIISQHDIFNDPAFELRNLVLSYSEKVILVDAFVYRNM